jgi:homoserine O-succinyltransferase/O-acetyltransferase
MPRAHSYERYLLRPLERAPLWIEPVWIRLETHAYTSSDADHIRKLYASFEQAERQGKLHGLILTGAPVEELAFSQVHYWDELRAILNYSRRNIAGTLGLCWGGLALGQILGLEKQMLPKKLFGAFQNRTLLSNHPLTQGFDDQFWCAHSRHSGIADAALEAASASGAVRLLSHGQETGYTLFESADGRFLAHLGHPEYEAERLVHEWERDSALGRTDVEPPRHFDVNQPMNLWRSHCTEVFARWLDSLVHHSSDNSG